MAGEAGQRPPIDLGAFEQIFQDMFGRIGPRRGHDLKQPLRISPTEAGTGGSLKVRVARRVACESCAGSGARDRILRDCPGSVERWRCPRSTARPPSACPAGCATVTR
jgi:DnaJ-class molecular chaperone